MWGLRGRVIHGIGRGGTELGSPTANVQLLRHDRGEENATKKMRDLTKAQQEALLAQPKSQVMMKNVEPYINGIFYGVAVVEGVRNKEETNSSSSSRSHTLDMSHESVSSIFPMVCSVGYNPHFGDITIPTVEVHLLARPPPPPTQKKNTSSDNNNSNTDQAADTVTSAATAETTSSSSTTSSTTTSALGDFYGSMMRALVVGKVPREQKKYESLQGLIDDIQSDCRYGWTQTVVGQTSGDQDADGTHSPQQQQQQVLVYHSQTQTFSLNTSKSNGNSSNQPTDNSSQQVESWLASLVSGGQTVNGKDGMEGKDDDTIDDPVFVKFLHKL